MNGTSFFPTATAPLLAAVFLTLPCGCGSTSDAARPASYDEAEASEHAYLNKAAVEKYDEMLKEFADAVSEENDNVVTSVRTRLTSGALLYKDALKSGLNDSKSTARRAISAAMLGFSGDATLALRLAHAAIDTNDHPVVRLRASFGLAELGERINDSRDRKEVMAMLRRMLLPSEFEEGLRANAVTAYARAAASSGDTLTPLTDALIHDGSTLVRRQVLVEFRSLRDPSVLTEITRVALNDPDDSIRAAAALALEGVDDMRALDALKLAKSDRHPAVRAQAVYALGGGRSLDPELVLALVSDSLLDFEEPVRRAAAIAAGRIGQPEITGALVQSLSDRSDGVRLASIESLGRILRPDSDDKYKKEIYPLVTSVADGNFDIAVASHRSLMSITGQTLDRSEEEWRSYFYTKYPELDPEEAYKDKPRPRYRSSGISSAQRRPPGARAPARQPARPQARPQPARPQPNRRR